MKVFLPKKEEISNPGSLALMLARETANWKKVETLLANISTSDVRYLFLLVAFILSLPFCFLCVCRVRL